MVACCSYFGLKSQAFVQGCRDAGPSCVQVTDIYGHNVPDTDTGTMRHDLLKAASRGRHSGLSPDGKTWSAGLLD